MMGFESMVLGFDDDVFQGGGYVAERGPVGSALVAMDSNLVERIAISIEQLRVGRCPSRADLGKFRQCWPREHPATNDNRERYCARDKENMCATRFHCATSKRGLGISPNISG